MTFGDRLHQLKMDAARDARQDMRDAIKRLQQEDPAKYAELLKRAQDEEYDRKRELETQAEEARRYAEIQQLAALEKARRFDKPVIVGLPDIDMSCVRGIVAFRVWNYDARGLSSTAMRYHWRELNFADNIPRKHNQSGFYCIKLTGLSVLTSGVDHFDTGRSCVSGFIELLGQVVEHTDGILRAEVARLICLFVTSENEDVGVVIPHLHELYPLTPVYVLNPEQLADVVLREVLRQRYLRGQM